MGEFDTKYLQPPIGVSPYWMTLRWRINELNDAINRYTEFVCSNHTALTEQQLNHYLSLMQQWNKEVGVLICALSEMLREYPFKAEDWLSVEGE